MKNWKEDLETIIDGWEDWNEDDGGGNGIGRYWIIDKEELKDFIKKLIQQTRQDTLRQVLKDDYSALCSEDAILQIKQKAKEIWGLDITKANYEVSKEQKNRKYSFNDYPVSTYSYHNKLKKIN